MSNRNVVEVEVVAEVVGVCLLVVWQILMVLLVPLFVLCAIDAIFPSLKVEYTFKTWLAALTLVAAANGWGFVKTWGTARA